MAYTPKNNSGALFKNDKKQSPEDNQPNYKGSALVGGVEYWVSSWVKKDSNGASYMSLSYEVKKQKASDYVGD